MNRISSIIMYIYIFGPSARGVETTSSKKWFRTIEGNLRKDRKHSLPEKLRAYRRGSLPYHVDRFGFADRSDCSRISQRDYFYLQPLNGEYSKWLDKNDVARKIFSPFADYLDTGTGTESGSGKGAETVQNARTVRVVMTNEKGYNPCLTECYDPETGSDESISAEAEELLKDMCLFAPQLCFFAVDILITEHDFRLVNFMNYPEYPEKFLFSSETAAFLNRKLDESKRNTQNTGRVSGNIRERIHYKTRQLFAEAFFPKELLPYLSTRWIQEVCKDLFSRTGASLKDKIWAYRHGFLSYRLEQYGITRENHLDYISDFEYKWLRHINGEYRVLFEDKITIKYIVRKFAECFPAYYYHIKRDREENVIIPMMDCPEGYGRTYDDILKLAREKGELALKPDKGSHGEGFYRLSYEEGRYFLNGEAASEEKVTNILRDRQNQYLVTEYIKNHPQFKAIYSGAVNTARMIVFKDEEGQPVLGNAYLRFGSRKTGAVDNMGAGGIFVQVDIETGRYHDAKIITHNSIEPCPNHPDTGVPLEGYIPHWEQVKETVLAVAADIEYLEYFGFDLAITEDGIKFPEINRFPDYPKIEKLSPLTTKYLLRKLEEKKRLVGYDKRPCRTLVHLPDRSR